jgi:hypothetical protein
LDAKKAFLCFSMLFYFSQSLADQAISAMSVGSRGRHGGAAAGLQQQVASGLSQVQSPPGIAASPGSTGGATTGAGDEVDDGGMLSGACDLLLLSSATSANQSQAAAGAVTCRMSRKLRKE